MRPGSELVRQTPAFLAPVMLMLLLVSACGSTTGPAIPESPVTPEDVLGHYEQIRAALARDDGSQVPATALRLARTARHAAAAATADTLPPLEELSAAAEELAALQGSDLNALRIAFGEVSRAVVSLVVADPALAEGRYVFRCPMSMGYKKWVQTSAELENPYMGSRMLHCGSETQWAR